MLDLRNLINVLQADCPDRPQHRIADSRTIRAGLPLLPVVIVRRPWDVSRATDLILRRCDASGREKESGCGRRAQLEVEGAIGADCDARGYRCTDVVVCCACVELLSIVMSNVVYWIAASRCHVTLQKSMLFTPLLPSAGPTGGDGDAWPAPTISLTIWSFDIAFFAIVQGVWWCANRAMESFGGPQCRVEKSVESRDVTRL